MGTFPTVSEVACTVFVVPTDRPEADGTLAWSQTTVVHVTVTAGELTGAGWTYAGRGCLPVVKDVLSRELIGRDPTDVAGAYEAMVRACRNLGRPGVVASAISAVDVACWDLKAQLLTVPLAQLFGRCCPEVALYGSGGFTTYDDATTSAQVEGWLEQGMTAMKIKIGESWGTELARDRARARLVRQVAGGDIDLFVDANGGYRRKTAIRMGRHFHDEADVTWFEEPVSSDDLEGLREVRDAVPQDVAAGEYGYDEPYFARMAGSGAVDCLQIDATRCGGFTSWLRVAAMAGALGLDVSAHCGPALHTQVGVAVPNLRHVEYFHDHERIESLLFDGVPVVHAGRLSPDLSRPGHGYVLKRADAEPYRVA